MKWIRVKELAIKLGVSRSQVRNIIKEAEDFPQSIRLSPKVVVYNEEEVDVWMASVQEAKRQADGAFV